MLLPCPIKTVVIGIDLSLLANLLVCILQESALTPANGLRLHKSPEDGSSQGCSSFRSTDILVYFIPSQSACHS